MSQIRAYEEEDYILYNPENDKYREEAKKINEEIKKLELERESILQKIAGVSLLEYKKQYL